MGYYIQTTAPRNKVQFLIDNCDAILIPKPEVFAPAPGTALICVVDNGPFQAAAYCFDALEFRDFSSPVDHRPKTWLLMDEKQAQELSGFRK